MKARVWYVQFTVFTYVVINIIMGIVDLGFLSSLQALQHGVGLISLHGFVKQIFPESVSVPRPNLNSKDDRLHFLWSLPGAYAPASIALCVTEALRTFPAKSL
jgi:hypothetical protein